MGPTKEPSQPNIISKVPLGPPDLKLVPPLPELIARPDVIQQQLDAQRQEQASTEEARLAEAAKNVIGIPPGYVAPVPVQTEQPEQPQPEQLQNGRFGLGVVPISMPADPNKVPGWDGIARY